MANIASHFNNFSKAIIYLNTLFSKEAFDILDVLNPLMKITSMERTAHELFNFEIPLILRHKIRQHTNSLWVSYFELSQILLIWLRNLHFFRIQGYAFNAEWQTEFCFSCQII